MDNSFQQILFAAILRISSVWQQKAIGHEHEPCETQ
jgi:hypothetical protein